MLSSLSELTPMIFNMGLSHLDSDVSNYLMMHKKMYIIIGKYYMEASEEEWVNSQNYKGKGLTLFNHPIATMVLETSQHFQ